jgi:hypothetical protein
MRGIVLGCGLWALDLRSGGFAMVVQPLRPTRCPGFLIRGVPERDPSPDKDAHPSLMSGWHAIVIGGSITKATTG